jgi:hypothetical protein
MVVKEIAVESLNFFQPSAVRDDAGNLQTTPGVHQAG